MSKLTHPFTEAVARLHKTGVSRCFAETVMGRESGNGGRRASAHHVIQDMSAHYSPSKKHAALKFD